MKKKQHLILGLLFLLFTQLIHAQKETSNWFFGNYHGITFNNNPVSELSGNAIFAPEGTSCHSDSEGNLLFYSDGVTIYNQNHEIMLNGEGLLSNLSSTQSSIIIPKPNDPNKYYIFCNAPKLSFSEIDMTLDNGLGGVTDNKNIILEEENISEKFSAVYDINTNTYYVATIKDYDENLSVPDQFLVIKVTENGVEDDFIYTDIDNKLYLFGQMKFSPNGKKVAMTIRENSELVACVYDFENDLTLTNRIELRSSITDNIAPYGIEFSSNSTYIYLDCNEGILKYDLSYSTEEQINESKLLVYDNPSLGGFQLGMDRKIYIHSFGRMFVINNPNIEGVDVGIEQVFENFTVFGSAGLPTFIQTHFKDPDFTVDNICVGEELNIDFEEHFIQNIQWDFGEPDSDTNIAFGLNPSHLYSSPGNYIITLNYEQNNVLHEVKKEVVVFDVPTVLDDLLIKSCKTEDGIIYSFDTSSIHENLLNNQENVEISYFDEEGNELPSPFPNTFDSKPQEIRVNLKNTLNENCTNEILIFLKIGDCEELMIEIPEGFSPNGDGINDLFVIKNLAEKYPNYKIEFYNRWGNKVYTDEKGKHWNGQLDGDNTRAAAGVYFFVLDFNEAEKEPYQGKLYLNR
ncbi:gliding motility-associated C-terminal domain-containing protein [Aureivirga sp. CE67]|uniref:T9SS type B sorting domain-containing protein n=1 Tax=Aureivirga sp. CE67 TaxID=1788983 RepID=UPI0018CBBE9F|nr:gliding motility-associated C-terminal domain-containing protein [Aureivirga sp. CE67]